MEREKKKNQWLTGIEFGIGLIGEKHRIFRVVKIFCNGGYMSLHSFLKTHGMYNTQSEP